MKQTVITAYFQTHIVFGRVSSICWGVPVCACWSIRCLILRWDWWRCICAYCWHWLLSSFLFFRDIRASCQDSYRWEMRLGWWICRVWYTFWDVTARVIQILWFPYHILMSSSCCGQVALITIYIIYNSLTILNNND